MEARILRAASLAALLVVSMGASYRTPNFLIQTSEPRLAEQFGKAAEQFRRDLAIAWLGKPMPEWSQPCVVTAHVGPNLGAGGQTTFVFDRGEVFGWRMTIQGSAQRILDSVLPHEITHMIFACRFRGPLPRWADEGGATSVEHSSERAKHYRMLVQFLRSSRGIAFNRMFSMDEYPRDIMPLYAQGYTLAEFLIQQGGRTKFLDFLSDGMQDDQWSVATSRHYGYQGVGALQNAWLAWVRQGFPRIRSSGNPANGTAQTELLADSGKRPRPEPNLIYRIGKAGRSDTRFENHGPGPRASGPAVLAGSNAGVASSDVSPSNVLPASGWHAVGERPASSPATVAVAPAPAEPVRTQVTRPQPIGRPHQTILEWGRR
jgi:hypothetical protein